MRYTLCHLDGVLDRTKAEDNAQSPSVALLWARYCDVVCEQK